MQIAGVSGCTILTHRDDVAYRIILFILTCLSFSLSSSWAYTPGGSQYLWFFLIMLCVSYLAFFSDLSSIIGPLHKAFLLTLAIPPLAHLVVIILSNARPLFAYPNIYRFSDSGELIETKSFAYSCFFLCLFLLFSGRPGINFKELYKARVERRPALFFAFVFQAFLYSSLSQVGNSLSTLSGGYGVDGSENFGGINAWNAMATTSLIVSLAFVRGLGRNAKLAFALVGIYTVVFSSLMYGKRADVVGLFLVLTCIVTLGKVSIRNGLILSFVGAGSLLLCLVVASFRTLGLETMDKSLSELVLGVGIWEGGRFILPSATDFFGTFPLVLSYVDLHGGDLWLGTSYFNALSTLLPSIIFPWRIEESATTFLQSNYWMNNGGMYFLGELYFNFGLLGLIVSAVILARLFNIISLRFVCRNNPVYLYIMLAAVAGFPRWLLYGSSAFTKHLFVIFIVCFVSVAIEELYPFTGSDLTPPSAPGMSS